MGIILVRSASISNANIVRNIYGITEIIYVVKVFVYVFLISGFHGP
jgi:hypothetical protein